MSPPLSADIYLALALLKLATHAILWLPAKTTERTESLYCLKTSSLPPQDTREDVSGGDQVVQKQKFHNQYSTVCYRTQELYIVIFE
ncbi:hypothetical protein Y1Q_0014447 [Alligator mississippiensis]|uniref:Secreted protein n=1 Tax=Alligator mississippiensis TaxID=8496 RepID=A0A151PCN8_ALLMI|nr:hypothetical protein Y1Q_0014447 [Alligator mississippiensis]